MLEQRRLLSVSLVGSTLTVNGTAGNDVATFTLSGSNLLVSDNGVNSSYATSSVNLIVFNGLDGNDNAEPKKKVTTQYQVLDYYIFLRLHREIIVVSPATIPFYDSPHSRDSSSAALSQSEKLR